MLHEVLAVLVGGNSSLLGLDSNLHQSISRHLHPAEINALESFAKIGVRFRRLKNFSEEWHQKAYMFAMARGFAGILDDLEAEIVTLEKESSTQVGCKSIPLGALLPTARKIDLHLEALCDILDRSAEEEGCKILNTLYGLIRLTGDSTQSQVINRVIHECDSTLRQQVASWLIYGRLFDPADEFFIVQVHDLPEVSSSWHETGDGVWTAFTVEESRRPNCISREVAEAILAGGKASTILNNDPSQYLDSMLRTDPLEESVLYASQCRQQEMWAKIKEEVPIAALLQQMRDFFLGGVTILLTEFVMAVFLSAFRTPEALVVGLNRFRHDATRRESSDLMVDRTLLSRLQFEMRSRTTSMELVLLSICLDRQHVELEGAEIPRLSCSLPWPSKLLMNDQSMSIYGTICNTQMLIIALKQRLLLMQECKHAREIGFKRWFILQFVNGYQQYIQSLISGRFTTMISDLRNPQDAHNSFVKHLNQEIIQDQEVGIASLLETSAMFTSHPDDEQCWILWCRQRQSVLELTQTSSSNGLKMMGNFLSLSSDMHSYK